MNIYLSDNNSENHTTPMPCTNKPSRKQPDWEHKNPIIGIGSQGRA